MKRFGSAIGFSVSVTQCSFCSGAMKLPSILEKTRESLAPIGTATDDYPAARRAAVLLLLYPLKGRIAFVLTKRPDTLSRHPGQIALPGGMEEAGDETLWHTALRETQEELGFRAGRIVPLGRLDEVQPRVGDSLITPFVAWNPVSPRFKPDPREVEDVLEAPLDWLLDPRHSAEEVWEMRGASWNVSLYRFEHWAVWGITALILNDFHERLAPGQRQTQPGRVRPAR